MHLHIPSYVVVAARVVSLVAVILPESGLARVEKVYEMKSVATELKS